MKNKEIFIVISIIIISFVLIMVFNKDENKEKKSIISEDSEVIMENAQMESDAAKKKKSKELTEIDVSTYLDYYNGEDQKLVLVARPTCHYCQIAEPILQNLSYKYKIDIYYLNTDNFSEEDSTKFEESDEALKDGLGTPTLLVVGNSTIIDQINGLTDTYHYTKFFKKNGYIK